MNRTVSIRLCVFAVVASVSLLISSAFAAPARAAERSATREQHTTASVNDGVLTIESYLQNADGETTTVRPTDYILVLDQSIWMNGTNGAERAQIISALNTLVTELADPTTGENRVAIAGYGRINVGTNYDPYDASEFPGTYPSSSRVSLNTGYYTTSGFKSYQGWTEVSDILSDQLPTLPDSYFSGVGYSDCFMTETDALSVLTSDSMCAWFAGASRMDAGFALAEKLAEIANQADPEGERDLSVVFVSSSLPILQRPHTNTSYIRSDAVLAAATKLKTEYGANIFAFGDYHPSNRVISGGNLPDTQESFNTVMTEICNKSDYYFPLGESDDLAATLQKLVTEVSIVSAGSAVVSTTVAPVEIVDGDVTTTLDAFMGDAKDAYLRTQAKVQLFDFTGFDADGNPVFSNTAHVTYEVPFEDLVGADGNFSYTAGLIPVPDPDTYDAAHPYGQLIRITITSPVTVDYQWGTGTAVPPKVTLPGLEYVLKGEHIYAPTLETADGRYVFLGWYTDPECTSELAGDASAYKDMTLYGKWERQVLVEFYWNWWLDEYQAPDSYEYIAEGETPTLFTPDDMEGYEFEGWYTDEACTQPYVPGAATTDLKIYAKWIDPDAPEGDGVVPAPEPEEPGDEGQTPTEPGSGEEQPSDQPGAAEKPVAPEGGAPAAPRVRPVSAPAAGAAATPDTGIETLPYAAVFVAGVAFLGLARLLKSS